MTELKAAVAGAPVSLLQLLVASASKHTFARIIACPTYPVAVRTHDLAGSVEALAAVLSSKPESISDLFARLYISARTNAYRKKAGQFFTALRDAEWAVSLAVPKAGDVVYDAGAGTAVFAEALLKNPVRVGAYVGVENDPILALAAAHVLEALRAPSSFRILYANFLTVRRTELEVHHIAAPTLVLSNPPFVRFQDLKSGSHLRAALKDSVGLDLSSFSGSAHYFLGRAVDLVSKESSEKASRPAPRMVFLFPEEATGAAHARKLREDLQRVKGWQCRQYAVPPASKGSYHDSSNTLARAFVFELSQLAVATPPVRLEDSVVLADVLSVRRGIATGCNDFFVLSQSEVEERAIPAGYLKAVIPTRIPLPDQSFERGQWEELRAIGHACWLLALPPTDPAEFDTSVRDYLKEGLRRGLHATATAHRLRKWFSLPIPKSPPDVFVTYLFRGAPRFITNNAGVLHLTNILGARFVTSISDPGLRAELTSELNRSAAGWMSNNMAGRKYRDDLMKIEPRELERLPLSSAAVDLLAREGRLKGWRERKLFV